MPGPPAGPAPETSGPAAPGQRWIPLGRITGVYGVRGWVKVFSYTEPRDRIVEYSPWRLRLAGGTQFRRVIQGRAQGSGVVAALDGIEDRDAAGALMGAEIEVERGCLPAPAEGEFYWADLEGLEVRTPAGRKLGVVDHLMATGANDVMVLVGEEGRRLVPFIYGKVVKSVDQARGVITADWSDDGTDDSDRNVED